jgi:hypothetical protein
MKPNRYRIRVVRLALLWERLVETHKSCPTCEDWIVCDTRSRIGAVDYALTEIVG